MCSRSSHFTLRTCTGEQHTVAYLQQFLYNTRGVLQVDLFGYCRFNKKSVPWSSLAALACAESSSTKHNVCNHNTCRSCHSIQMHAKPVLVETTCVLNFGAAFSAACNQRATATLAHPAASSTTPEQHPRTLSSLQPAIRTKQRAY